ncbi:MAG TPA: hypothetical protein VF939_13760 [Puia sp.]
MRKTLSRIFIVLAALPACQSIKKEDKQLASHYIYRSKGLDKRFIDPQNALGKNIIYADVTDYASSDSFILVRQKPSDRYLKNHLGFYLYFRFLAYADYLRNPSVVNTEDGRFMKGFIETDSINYQLFMHRQASENNTAKDKDIEWAIADSLIHYDPYYKKIASGEDNYWILQLSADTLLGPFSKAAYGQERKLLRIPENLKLKSEE